MQSYLNILFNFINFNFHPVFGALYERQNFEITSVPEMLRQSVRDQDCSGWYVREGIDRLWKKIKRMILSSH